MSENVYKYTYLVTYLLCFGHLIRIKRKFEICQIYIRLYKKNRTIMPSSFKIVVNNVCRIGKYNVKSFTGWV